MAQPRKYDLEIWYRGQTKLGEIGRLVNSLKWTEKRNGVGGIDFNIDNGQLINYCQHINEDPMEFIQQFNTDVKLKRNGQYRIGGFLADFPEPNFNQNNMTQNFSADSYENLLSDQRVQTSQYSQVETTDIAWDIIADNNARQYSTLGITKSTSHWFTTGVKRDRTYDNDQMSLDALIKLTSLGDGSHDFDFRLTPLREFQTFDFNNPTIHSDVIVEYPAPRRGIAATSTTVGFLTTLANDILAKGSGQGTATLLAESSDINSKLQYGNHDKVISYSDVSVANTLQQYADAELKIMKQPIFLPKVHVNGSQFDLNNIYAGDVIRVKNSKSPWFGVDGYYRIEQMVVTVNQNSDEDIELTLSNIGLPAITETA